MYFVPATFYLYRDRQCENKYLVDILTAAVLEGYQLECDLLTSSKTVHVFKKMARDTRFISEAGARIVPQLRGHLKHALSASL